MRLGLLCLSIVFIVAPAVLAAPTVQKVGQKAQKDAMGTKQMVDKMEKPAEKLGEALMKMKAEKPVGMNRDLYKFASKPMAEKSKLGARMPKLNKKGKKMTKPVSDVMQPTGAQRTEEKLMEMLDDGKQTKMIIPKIDAEHEFMGKHKDWLEDNGETNKMMDTFSKGKRYGRPKMHGEESAMSRIPKGARSDKLKHFNVFKLHPERADREERPATSERFHPSRSYYGPVLSRLGQKDRMKSRTGKDTGRWERMFTGYPSERTRIHPQKFSDRQEDDRIDQLRERIQKSTSEARRRSFYPRIREEQEDESEEQQKYGGIPFRGGERFRQFPEFSSMGIKGDYEEQDESRFGYPRRMMMGPRRPSMSY